MTPNPNIEIVQKAYQAYATRNFAAVFGLLDPTIEIEQTPALPWGGHYTGIDGARQFFTKLATEVQAAPEPETYIPAGDDIAVVGRLRGKIRRSGHPVDIAIVHVWTVREGKLVKFVAYIDTPAMLEALAVPPPAAADGEAAGGAAPAAGA